MQSVLSNPDRTAMEVATASDELGFAYLRAAKPKQALAELNRALELAPQGLNVYDSEWSIFYWHRALAHQQAGHPAEADRDFSKAEEGLSAASTSADGKVYVEMLNQLRKQHAFLVENRK